LDIACSTHGRNENAYGILVEKIEGKNPLGDARIVGKIILKLILKKLCIWI